MHQLLAITFLIAGQAAVDVEVTTVDQQVVTGTVETWTHDAIAVTERGQSSRTVPLAEVLRVDQVGAASDELLASVGEVTLVDGTRLAVSDFKAFDGKCQLSVVIDPPIAMEASLDSVRSVRFMPTPEALPKIANEWRDLLAMDTAGDLIVIRKAEAENLNFVEGTLGNVGPDAVQFTLDEQTLQVNRARVFGVAYYRDGEQEGAGSPVAVVSGQSFHLPARAIAVEGDLLLATTEHLGVVKLPIASVRSVDYSIDRVQYLSDLEPKRLERQDTTGATPASPLFANFARDRGFYSAELALEYPADSLPADQVGSAGLSRRVAFPKGLAIRSRTELTYQVPKGFQKFCATAAIDPMTRVTGGVELKVFGDDEPLYQQTILGSDAPVEVQCDVRNVRELKIVVDFGPTGGIAADTGDNLHLGGARFTK